MADAGGAQKNARGSDWLAEWFVTTNSLAILLRGAELALEALARYRFDCFDPPVGDNACQIRTLRNLVCFRKLDVRSLAQRVAATRKNARETLAFSDDESFVMQSFLLTCAKVTEQHQQERDGERLTQAISADHKRLKVLSEPLAQARHKLFGDPAPSPLPSPASTSSSASCPPLSASASSLSGSPSPSWISSNNRPRAAAFPLPSPSSSSSSSSAASSSSFSSMSVGAHALSFWDMGADVGISSSCHRTVCLLPPFTLPPLSSSSSPSPSTSVSPWPNKTGHGVSASAHRVDSLLPSSSSFVDPTELDVTTVAPAAEEKTGGGRSVTTQERGTSSRVDTAKQAADHSMSLHEKKKAMRVQAEQGRHKDNKERKSTGTASASPSPSKRAAAPTPSSAFTSKLVSKLRKQMAIDTVKFIQRVAADSKDQQLIAGLRDELVRHTGWTPASPGGWLACLPMYWSYRALLGLASTENLPLLVLVSFVPVSAKSNTTLKQERDDPPQLQRSQSCRVPDATQLSIDTDTGDHQTPRAQMQAPETRVSTECLYYASPTAKESGVPHPSALNASVLVVQGVAASEPWIRDPTAWKRKMTSLDIRDILLAAAADHVQYPADVKDAPRPSEFDNEEEAHARHREFAQKYGCSLTRPHLFFVQHVYPCHAATVAPWLLPLAHVTEACGALLDATLLDLIVRFLRDT